MVNKIVIQEQRRWLQTREPLAYRESTHDLHLRDRAYLSIRFLDIITRMHTQSADNLLHSLLSFVRMNIKVCSYIGKSPIGRGFNVYWDNAAGDRTERSEMKSMGHL